MTKTLTVDLGEHSYPIYIGENLLETADYINQHISGKHVVVITNETIAPLYLEKLQSHLTSYKCDVIILKDGEQFKNIDTLNDIYTALLEKRCDRKTTLIALGGGVIGDITGFAAASYQRGVPFIQVPTTLLAQVDSSVGGKTAVNHKLGKNMIGAFYQPQCVIADTKTLSTLPDREFSAGLAEVIKYGLIRDSHFFAWLENNIEKLLLRDSQALTYAIEQSCKNKAEVVAEDEHENGIRAILNLGHTFGHAIETYTGYTDWLHGEAVGAGMYMAATLSHRLDWLSNDDLKRTYHLIEKAKLPIIPPKEMTTNDFKNLMALDKKVLDGVIRLILLKGIGQAVISSDYSLEILENCLNQLTTD